MLRGNRNRGRGIRGGIERMERSAEREIPHTYFQKSANMTDNK